MGAHIVNGVFQSDKYPTCPPGKVPLSVNDPTAQDLLWEYAQRRRGVDAEFSDDLETCLRAAGYEPKTVESPQRDSVITDQDIDAALVVIAAASKGPAVWAAGSEDTEEIAVQRFLDHYRKAKEVTGSSTLNQVDLPVLNEEAHCMAITGNGPLGAANAKYIAGSLDPVAGWEAALLEVRRLKRENASMFAELRATK